MREEVLNGLSFETILSGDVVAHLVLQLLVALGA